MSRDSLEEVRCEVESALEPTELASKRDEVQVSVPFYDGEVLLTVNQLKPNKFFGIKIKKQDAQNVAYKSVHTQLSTRNECAQFANGSQDISNIKLQINKKKVPHPNNQRLKSYLEQYRERTGINTVDESKQPSSVRPNIGDLECESISSFGTLYCEDKCDGECFNDVFYNSIINKSEHDFGLKLRPSEEGNDPDAAVIFGNLRSISETGEADKKKSAKNVVRIKNVAPLGSLGPDIQRIRAQNW